MEKGLSDAPVRYVTLDDAETKPAAKDQREPREIVRPKGYAEFVAKNRQPEPKPPKPTLGQRIATTVKDAASSVGTGLSDAAGWVSDTAKQLTTPAASPDQATMPDDGSFSDPMGSGVGASIMQQAAPPAPAPGEVLMQPVPGFKPSQADLVEQSKTMGARLNEAQQLRIQESRLNAPTLRAAPDQGALQSEINSLNRKPLDNSLAGVAKESAGDMLRGVAQTPGALAKSAWGLVQMAADQTGNDKLAGIAFEAAKAGQQSVSRYNNPNGDSLLTDTVRNLTTVAIGGAAGGAHGGIALIVGQATGDKYQELRAAKVDPSEAAPMSVAYGIAEFLGERIGIPSLGRMFNGLAKKDGMSAAVNFLKEAAKQQAEEQGTQAIQSLIDKFGAGSPKQDMTFDQYLDDVIETAKQTALMSGLAGGAGLVRRAGSAAASKLTRPTDLRADTFRRFDDLAAEHGLPDDAVKAAKDAVAGKPLDEVPGILKRIVSSMSRNGLFGRPVPEESLGRLDHPEDGPVDASEVLGAVQSGAQNAEQDQATPAVEQAKSKGGTMTQPTEAKQAQPSPASSAIDEAAHGAATSPLNDKPQPTDAQKEAGNYAKGHVTVQGLDIAVENPRGSTRSGTSPEGVKWETTMQHHYGYIKGTVGNDKDHVDTFIGQNPDSQRAFVVDQIDPKTGEFDEHKVVLGADSLDQAREIYQSNYEKDWNGLGAITELPMAAFKSWVKDGAKRAPLGDISTKQQEAAGNEQIGQNPHDQAAQQQASQAPAGEEGDGAPGAPGQEQGQPAQPAAEQGGSSGLKPGTIRAGKVGGKYSAGEVLSTSSGRETSPFPKIDTSTNGKANNTYKRVDQWLMQNALDEAKARGDDFNARQFASSLSKPTQSDKDSAEEYLFGDQPAVVPSILKPLSGPSSQANQDKADATPSKIFKTRKAAEAHRDSLGNGLRLQKVKGGYKLRAKTDAELAAESKGAQRLKKGAPTNVQGDSLLTAIAKAGGLAMSEKANTITEGNKNAGGKMVFTNDGQPLDIMAQTLAEDGYIPPNEMESDGGVSWLQNAIGEEFGGHAKHFSHSGEEWMRKRADAERGDAPDYDAAGAPDSLLDATGYFDDNAAEQAARDALADANAEASERAYLEAEDLFWQSLSEVEAQEEEHARQEADQADAQDAARHGSTESPAAGKPQEGDRAAPGDAGQGNAGQPAGKGRGTPVQGKAQEGLTAGTTPKNGKAKPGERLKRVESYFTPGNIVQGYGGFDRVISFKWDEGRPGSFSVTVQHVVKDGDGWKVDPSDARERTHSTQPGERELKQGAVGQWQDAPILSTQTEEDLRAKSEREDAAKQQEATRRAADQEKVRQADEARDNKARADATVDDFQLGQSADQQMSGMGDLFANGQEVKPSTNTVFTEDAAAKAREILRKKLGGTLNSGIDPELLQAGITLAGYHIEKGARTFSAYAKAMIEDLGNSVAPYLKSWYMGVKYDPRASGFDGMSGAAEVEAADVSNLQAPKADITKENTGPADEKSPMTAWRDAAPSVRREMLKHAGYTDADQARALSGMEWGDLTDPVRRALKWSAPKPSPVAKQSTGHQIIEHVTKGGAGKTLRGIVRTDISKDEAVAIDPATFRKDGGYFIREKYLSDIPAEQQAGAEQKPEKAAASLRESLYSAIKAGNMPKDNPALRKMVEEFDGVPADNARLKQAQEDLEAATAQVAREIVSKGEGDRTTFDILTRLYASQPNLNIRTSTSIDNQAYSTPAPLAFIGARLAGIDKKTKLYEPTAGNGMLTITALPANVTATEMDGQRFDNLKAQGIKVTQGDALKVDVPARSQDAVYTNPPFGPIKDGNGNSIKVKYDGYTLGQIDHLIAARALESMRDDGRATLIIGANKSTGQQSNQDLVFFNWLYANYHVTSHFEVDGDLYMRQGAGWPVRVITIHGRVKSESFAPSPDSILRARTWGEVYEQFQQGLDSAGSQAGNGASAVGAQSRREDDAKPVSGPADVQAGQADSGRSKGGTPGNGDVSGAGARTVVDRPAVPTKPMGEPAGAKRSDAGVAGAAELERPTGSANESKPSGNTGASSLSSEGNQFQAPYVPRSSRKDEGVLIPVNMAGPTQDALNRLEDEVGDIDSYAAKELGYKSTKELHDAFMGLQVDSVASAIYQIKSGKGAIIADQTGIGKGRQAAGVIRWAALNGKIPVFVTLKPSLFTDMYGDLRDIGTDNVAPLIMNSAESIKGNGDERLFANKLSTHRRTLEAIASTGELPAGRNAVFMTYSQINVANVQRQAIMALAPNAVFVLDESHSAGGDSSTGSFIRDVLSIAHGVTYLSATYAKRPDNMPVYFKTDIGDAVADDETLMSAMASGGLPLQTVVANNLVKAGQMFRRERSYDGVSIESRADTSHKEEHVRLSDETTLALRAIVNADRVFHTTYVKALQDEAKREGSRIHDMAGNQAQASVDHTQFSSVVHNFVRQMLLGLKAQESADEAIRSIKRGEKPLIAVEGTMGSFLAEYAANNELKEGDSLGSFDYRTVLSRALDRTRYIIRQLPNGDKVKEYIPLSKLDSVSKETYLKAQQVIDSLVIDIPVSPIDWMRNEITKAGYTVAEITGRNLSVDYSDPKNPKLSQIDAVEQKDKVRTTRQFNSGKLDAIVLNVAGSTGISLHASEKFTDQRQRHMIVAQAAQDINTFMQMLGRIHRTGQVKLPKYTILSADLPAEIRPTALLSGKMKSLNANTSSNTESATSVKSADMLNKYGDQVVGQYLADNPELSRALDITPPEDGGEAEADTARRATGRLALMPVKVQEQFYAEVEEQYQSLIDYLNKTNQNDLEPRTFDFDAQETKSQLMFEGQNKESPFGEDAIYGEYSVKAQGKAMTPAEIKSTMDENLAGKSASLHNDEIIERLNEAFTKYTAGLPDDQRDAALAVRNKTARFVRDHAIGAQFRVDINGDHYNAVVTNIRSTHKAAGNPYSLSKIQVTIAVNGALRTVTVPATQFSKIETSRVTGYGSSIDQLFKVGVANEREIAKIVTGNLLGAYGEMNGTRGSIITFTKADGTTEQGILLPKAFNIARDARGDYRLKTPELALKYLTESEHKDIGKFGISSRDGAVRVLPRSGGGITIQVPKSKAKGGKFFLDQKLRATTGDFITVGNYMLANVDANKSVSALDVLMRKSALYALPSMAEDARSITGEDGMAPSTSLAVGVAGKLPNDLSIGKNRGAASISKVELDSVVDRVAARWKGLTREDVVTIESWAGLPLDVIQYALAHGGVKMLNGIEGLAHKGKVYLVRKAISSREHAEEVLLHEAIGHLGAEAIMGGKSAMKYGALWDQLGGEGGIKKKAMAIELSPGVTVWDRLQPYIEAAKKSPNQNARKSSIANEFIAFAAQQNDTGIISQFKGYLSDLKQGLARFCRLAGLNGIASRLEQMSAIDVAAFVRDARRAIIEGKLPNGGRYVFIRNASSASKAPSLSLNAAPQVPSTRDELDAGLTPSTGPIDTILRRAGGSTLARLTSPAYTRLLDMMDRGLAAVGGRAYDYAKAGLTSDHGLTEPYLDARADMRTAIRQGARETKTVIDSLQDLDRAQSRVAYLWMNEKPDSEQERALLESLPEESRKVLTDLKARIEELSKEAVRLGLLSQEAYERNSMAYLHRSYQRYEVGDKAAKAIRSRAIKILGDQFKGRGMRDDVAHASIKGPDWWQSKQDEGGADTSLKGQKFRRLELRELPDADTGELFEGGKSQKLGRLRSVVYWPADEAVPSQYADWRNAGTWEARYFNKPGKVGMWRDFTLDERTRMGEIQEVRYSTAKTMLQMTRDVETARLLDWVARKEAKAMEDQIPDEHTVAPAKESMLRSYLPTEWVQVPDTAIPGTGGLRRYGNLAGRYVPGPVWNDIRQITGMTDQGDMAKAYADILRMWKISKTALSPTTHMNNVMSNFIFADLHDVQARHILKAIKAWATHKKDKAAADLIAEYQDNGGDGGKFNDAELREDVMGEMIAELEREVGKNSPTAAITAAQVVDLIRHREFRQAFASIGQTKTAGALKIPAKKLMKLYGHEDELFRLAAYIKARDDGLTGRAAGKFAHGSFLNYDINAPWVQAARRSFFPFISFTYRAVPMLARTFADKPWKAGKYALVAGALNAAAYAMMGMGGGDEDKERALLPDEKSGKIWGIFPKLMRMPWNDEHESPVFLDVRRWIPAGDVIDFGQGHTAVPVPSPLMPGGPLVVLGELILNKSSFTGKPITMESDTLAEKYGKVGDYLWKAMAPNVPLPGPGYLIPGIEPGQMQTYAWKALTDAGSGKTDTFGREQSVGQALLSSVGVKVAAYPPDVLMQNRALDTRSNLAEVDRQINAARRQFDRNGISEKELQEKIDDGNEKRKEYRQGLSDKQEAAGLR